MDIIHSLKITIKNYIEKKYQIDATKYFDLSFNTDPTKEDFGDITTNAALIYGYELEVKPYQLAQELKGYIHHEAIKKIEIAEPGFINIFLKLSAFQNLAKDLFINNDDFFKDLQNKKQTYSIEFVSANPTGPLHVGNGRGGVIGDVLGNILRFLGNKVIKEYYVNDTGSQIQKLGMSLRIRCLQELGEKIELPEDAYHGEYLIEIAKKCIDEYGPELKSKPIEFFADYAKNHILENIKKTLTNYGITFDVWFSETTLHKDESIDKIIDKLKQKNLIYEYEGALWFKSTEFGDDKDRVLKKSGGEFTYFAPDIAYLQNKIDRGADKLIYVFGQDHHGYINRLKGAVEALGYNRNILSAILYQLVTIKESGKILRLSKRAGKIITLEDIIQTVGSDIARFFYLHKKAEAHLDFDVDLALKQTEENPVYYIQYAYVRTKSILQNAQQENILCRIDQEDAKYIGSSEKILLKKIFSLKQLLKSISYNYQTHLLTYYTLELAQFFHSYYNAHRIISTDFPEQSRGRLFTTLLIKRTLKICFDLLGISAPEKM